MKLFRAIILTGFLTLTSQTAVLAQSADEPAAAGVEAPKPIKEWKEIAGFGTIKIIYMSSTGLADNEYVEKILKQIVKKEEPLTVWIFDEEASTPHTLPFTDAQKLHWKAQFTYNPETEREAFAFIEPVTPMDPNAKTVELKETKTDIGTGYFK